MGDIIRRLDTTREKTTPSPERRSKVPAVRYASDDCILHMGRELGDNGEISVEGTPYPLHEGEWVELQPLLTVRAQLELLNISGDAGVDSLVRVSEMMASRITAWNWTGMEYESLPNPPSADDLLNLHNDEWLYLIGLLSKGATDAAASKNV